MTNRYLSAKEVAELLGIAESTAYAVIRGWNKELKAQLGIECNGYPNVIIKDNEDC